MRRAHRLYLLVVTFIIMGAALAAAQGLPTVKPEKVGLSSERLERLGDVMQQYIDEGRIAGTVTIVARDGKAAWFKTQGMLDREAGTPMRPDAIFRICSMSKPITSVAVMMLYEEGKFLLDDPVWKYLPEFKDPQVLVKRDDGTTYTVPASTDITIRHLLTHTSGIGYHWSPDVGQMYFDAGVAHGMLQTPNTTRENSRKIAQIPLMFNPGERFQYGLSIDVLGALVEVLSGMSFDEYLRVKIFEPLKMTDTFFSVPESKMDQMTTAYTWYDGKGMNRFPDEPIDEGSTVYSSDYPYDGPRRYFSGGAGLSSSVPDYARFCQMMLNGGELDGVRLLSPKTVQLMTHDQIGDRSPNSSFGLGFGIEGVDQPLRELTSPGRYGWGGFFYTHFFIDPAENMVGVFMAQLHPAGGLPLNRLFEVLAYQSVVESYMEYDDFDD